MANAFLPGSFTKNFSWRKDPRRLHRCIRNGFSKHLSPVTRQEWRANSGLDDTDIELIPLNFFLYSKAGVKDDYVLVDQLVELSVSQAYSKHLALLALFAFHLANSGRWRDTKWPDGRVAGWANLFIRQFVWRNNEWTSGAFETKFLKDFFERHLEATPGTKRKTRTNYRFMVESTGLLANGKLQPMDATAEWPLDATQLFWDRQIFDGRLRRTDDLRTATNLFFEHEIYKLLGCSEDQGRAFAAAAFREYSHGRMAQRFKQLDELRELLALAA